jgi:hypothetical protein
MSDGNGELSARYEAEFSWGAFSIAMTACFARLSEGNISPPAESQG